MHNKTNVKSLSNNELSSFCSQMAMMSSAGITISEALRLQLDDAENAEAKRIISAIVAEIAEGSSLYSAMQAPGVFPKYALDMIHIGEQTGNLDHVFTSLAAYYEREENISQGIRSAVTYPFIMIGMMLIVILVLIIKVLPIFEQVFQQLGTTMTGFSGTILRLGKQLGNYSVLFVSFFALLVLCYLIMTRSKAGREHLHHFACGFPLTRGLYNSIAAGRFASGMALALSSGFNTEQGLEMVSELINNSYYAKRIDACSQAMKNGEHFADAVVHSGIFAGTYGRMVAIGFKSGKLDEIMNKVAERYETEIDYKITHFVSILEPTLVAVLSIIVGMILLSVMLPLMGIMSSIG